MSGTGFLGGGVILRDGFNVRGLNAAATLWRQAADSWYQRNSSAAFALTERDDETDELHASLIAELAARRMAPLRYLHAVTIAAPAVLRIQMI